MPDASGPRTWTTIAVTEPIPPGTKNHPHPGIVLSPDRRFVYFNSGSRTDHGEVADGFRNAFDMAFAPNGDLFATDACGAHLMGHDPSSDWLTPPFHRDRNALRVAAEAGFGTVDLERIDFESEVEPPVGEFYANLTDAMEVVHSWQRTTCEQGLFYREHRHDLVERYAGQYILLQQGQVRWSNEVSDLRHSRRQLSGTSPEQAMWLKYVDPDETEGEHYTVYERGLERFDGERLRAA